MTFTILKNAILRRIRNFQQDRRGNVAIIFAMLAVPMVGFAGAAIDYTRSNAAWSAMQAAMDSTALMLSKDAQKLSPEELTQKTNAYFNALFNRPGVHDVNITSVFSNPTSGSYQLDVTGTAEIDTTFWKVMKVIGLGQDTIDLRATSQVVWGMKKLELVLALDNTLSMASSSKMTELQKATRNLLDTLYKAAKEPGDVKVAIVPFATSVNVDKSQLLSSNSYTYCNPKDSKCETRTATTTFPTTNWLDWSHWEAQPAILDTDQGGSLPSGWEDLGPGSDCPFTDRNYGFVCAQNSTNGSSTVSKIPSSGTYKGYICPAVDSGKKNSTRRDQYYNGCYKSEWVDENVVASGSSSASCGTTKYCTCSGSGKNKVCKQKAHYEHPWVVNDRTTWNGCVWDRQQNNDVNDTTPSSTLMGTMYQPHQVSTCPASLITLTDIRTGWVEADKDAKTPTSTLGKKVKSMTPTGYTNVTIGLEWGWHALTQSEPLTQASQPKDYLDKVIILLTDGDNTQNRWTTNADDIDDRTDAACTNAKNAGFKLYTVRVIDGNATLLRGCATNTSMYYNVEDAEDLNGVFTDIADNLAQLRIAK